MEEIICTPLDSAIRSGEMMMNQAVLTYSITEMMTPMTSTAADTDNALEPAGEHGGESAGKYYAQQEAHDAADLLHESVLEALDYCQGQEHKNDNINNTHIVRI